MKYVILTIIALISFPVFSAEKQEYDCINERNKIIHRLSKDITCNQDKDCRYFDFGYPWQLDVCMKPILSITEEARNLESLRLISIFNKKCVFNDSNEKTKFEEFKAKVESSKCDLARTFCLSGICRTSGYVMYDQPDAVIRDKSNITDVEKEEILKGLKGK
jgi:hypothetical protein